MTVQASSHWFNQAVDLIDSTCRVQMRLSGWLAPHRVGTTFFNARMNCDIRDFIQRRIYFFQIFEPNLSYYMMERLTQDDVVADVGANVGYITLLASHLAGPGGKVFAIEAAPSTFAKLSANLDLNNASNVTAMNLAATDEECLIEIVEGERRNSGSNAVRKALKAGSSSVQGKPLSSILGASLAEVSFIKIDVEGSEAPILSDIIRNLGEMPKLRTIVSEMGPASAEYVAALQSLGFKAYGLPNNYRIGATLVRRYLDRTSEGRFVTKIPVDAFDPAFTDFVFER
jgi:FkbM family methyltransferase